MLTIKIKYSVILNSHVTFTTLNFLIFQKVGLTFDPLYQKSVTDEKNQREERGMVFQPLWLHLT